MKLKVKITGPKVHDVGYRCFLMSMAMNSGIRRFEAHNTNGPEGEKVLVLVDGDKEGIDAFRTMIKTERPDRSEVSNIIFDDFDGEVMRIGEYAQFCFAAQLNKLISALRSDR
ncbi:MAG: hypothetical protein HPY61_03575 [Methanotrichaceae archaeon]|nr:hypothetical protein [Methanotrichaceae archaeon]